MSTRPTLLVLLGCLAVFASTTVRAQTGEPSPVLSELLSAPELLDEATQLFDRGVDLYEDEPEQARRLFTEAMIRYDAMVEQHEIQNTELLLNLANSAMLAKDTGRAVLAFRRAQRLSPSNARVQRGLAQARGRVGVDMDRSSGAHMQEFLLAWRGVVPRSGLAGIAIAGYLVLWGLAFCRLLGVASWTRTVLLPSAIVTGVSLGLLLFEQRAIASSKDAVINREAEALNGPSEGVYEPTFDHDLPAGVEATMLERRDGWIRIELIDGRQTWVRESAATPI